MFVFPVAKYNLHLWYKCGSEITSDTNVAPMFCLDCGAPWGNFEVSMPRDEWHTLIKGGWKPPFTT